MSLSRVLTDCSLRSVAVYDSPRRRVLQSALVASFIWEWSQSGASSVEEFAAWANVPPRTAYRRLESFRLMFPEYDYPTDYLEVGVGELVEG